MNTSTESVAWSDPSLEIGGVPLPKNRHVCGFFRGPDEQYRILLPFIKDGIDRGEKAVHVVKRSGHVNHLERLRSFGIDVDKALSSGQLEVLDWESTYLSGGRFEISKMPDVIRKLISKSRAEGYPRLRYVGNMEWSLEKSPGVEDVIEYESRLHPILLEYPDPVICCYDVGQYPADSIVEILRVHQVAVVCGHVSENPYFVTPDQYLQERLRVNVRCTTVS
ncbi:MAG: MEDS domain-containing protein [Elusimicrobia bacterium]|nr:MEDS domain-containing protein [Elusimicrobiota bacterium]